MQSTTQLWKTLYAKSTTRLETKAIINNVEYDNTHIEPPVITRALTQNGVSFGNVVSAVCALTVYTTNAIPKSAQVQIKMRLVEGVEENPNTSEWLSAGTFYVSRRTEDPIEGTIALECYDALLKANAVWEPVSDEWPQTAASVVTEIAAVIGVAIDSRTTLNPNFTVSKPENGTLIRDVLSTIGAYNYGNWILTPENKLRLVPLVSADGADSAVNDVVEVDAVVGSMTKGKEDTITGIRCTVEDTVAMAGDDTGIIIDTTIPAIVAADLIETIGGMKHRPFTLGTAYYDPAAELGDFVRYDEDIASVLVSETVELGVACTGDISSPDPAEMADEYPYIGANTQAIQIVKAQIKELNSNAIIGVDVEYIETDSDTEPPDEDDPGWQTDPPEHQEGYYLWQRTATTTLDGTTYSDPVCISGRDGTSVTIDTIEYAVSNSGDTAPVSGWDDTVPELDKGDWLWVKTTYSNGQEMLTCSYIGTDGEDGNSVIVQSVVKSGNTTTVTLVDGEGEISTLTINDGEDGPNGTPGANGYVHIAWANSADGVTDFSTSVSTDKKYMGVYTDNTQADSNNPSDYSWSLIRGDDGANTATIMLYKRTTDTSVSKPSVSAGYTTYTFSSKSLSPVPTNWSTSIPSGDAPCWVSAATAVSTTATDRINNSEWTTPVKLAENGENGTDGLNQATVMLYQRAATAPNKPSVDTTYTFSTGVLSPIPTGWSRTIPDGSDPCYVTSAVAISTEATDTIVGTPASSNEWAGVTKMVEDGVSATVYDLVCSPSALVRNQSGTLQPSSITFSATQTKGTGTPSAYSGRFKIEEYDGSSWTTKYPGSSNESSKTYSPTSTAKSVRATLYKAGGTSTQFDTQTVPIVSDGADGSPGGSGADAYTVLLSNEAHTFPAGTSAAVASSTTSQVLAFKGKTQIAATIGTISGKPTGMTTTITSNGTTSAYFTVNVTSSLTQASGVLTIPVTVDTNVQFSLKFSWSLAFTGQTGAQGKGTSAVVEQYYLSTSNTTQTGGSWSTAQPTWSSGKYIWTRTKVTWTDGTVTYTDPILAKAINGANKAVSDLNTALNQQEIFDRLTGGGSQHGLFLSNGELYVNASYIKTGTLDASQMTVTNLSASSITSGTLTAMDGIWLHNSNDFGFQVGPYGDVAIGKKLTTSQLSSFSDNKTAFQVNNWGEVKAGGEIGLWYQPSSSSNYVKSGALYTVSNSYITLAKNTTSSWSTNITIMDGEIKFYTDQSNTGNFTSLSGAGVLTLATPLAITSGGTGGAARDTAINNLTRLTSSSGAIYNITGGASNDTRQFWSDKGTGVTYFNNTGMVQGQPSQWGFITSLVYGSEVNQIWHTQGEQGLQWRVANSSFSTMPTWTKILDETDIKTKTLSNQTTSGSGNVNFSLSSSSYVVLGSYGPNNYSVIPHVYGGNWYGHVIKVNTSGADTPVVSTTISGDITVIYMKL